MTAQMELFYEMGGPLAVARSDATDPAALPGDPLFDFVLVPVKHAAMNSTGSDRPGPPPATNPPGGNWVFGPTGEGALDRLPP